MRILAGIHEKEHALTSEKESNQCSCFLIFLVQYAITTSDNTSCSSKFPWWSSSIMSLSIIPLFDTFQDSH